MKNGRTQGHGEIQIGWRGPRSRLLRSLAGKVHGEMAQLWPSVRRNPRTRLAITPEGRERFAITFHDHVASAYQGRPEGLGGQTVKVLRPESR